jgi:hypothetical protein
MQNVPACADCEVRHTAVEKGGIRLNETNASLERCLFADNRDNGVYCELGSTRMEACTFLRNGFDIYITYDAFLFTDTPASALSMGCVGCTSSNFGPVLPLASAPAGEFLTGGDTDFVALQLVRLAACQHYSCTEVLAASRSSPLHLCCPVTQIFSLWPLDSDTCWLLLAWPLLTLKQACMQGSFDAPAALL